MMSTTRLCPEAGDWRAWFDADAPAPELDDHLETCAGCQAVVADLRDALDHARGSVAMLAPPPPTPAEIAFARRRLELRREGRPAPSVVRETVAFSRWQRLATRWRVAGSGIAAALALTLVVALTPQGQAGGAGFLAQFRSQSVTAVEVTPQSQADITRTLSTLANLGTIQTPAGAVNPARPEGAARDLTNRASTVTLAQATQTLGFPVQTPEPRLLPSSLDKTPTVRLVPASQIRFTFDKNKARTYLQSTGHANVNLPDKFDGASIVVRTPAAALIQYSSTSSKDAVIFAQSGELVVDAEGNVGLDEMRDFLLGLPGLPPATVNQLKQIKNWNQTLPIPVPVDMVDWKPVSFRGNQGLLLNDNSGVASAAIWHENGHLIGAASSLKATDLKKLADSLAPR